MTHKQREREQHGVGTPLLSVQFGRVVAVSDVGHFESNC